MKTKKVEVKTKREQCRFCHPSIFDMPNWHCVVDGWEDDKVKTVSKEQCEECERFDSKFIEYPLTIQGIDNEEINTSGLGHECGALCEISPCGKEYEGKSYMGIYLGDLPIAITSSYSRETGILSNRTMNNPAIFVPELKKIIYGCESWWREIKSMEDLQGNADEPTEESVGAVTVKDLVELNFNRGIGRIKLFNRGGQECFFSGNYSELLDSQAADEEVISWEFVPKQRIGAIEWEFVLEIVCDVEEED